MLNFDTYGAGEPPLMIVHGLYGSARNWGVISRRLSEDRKVIAVDQRNHGDSPWYDSHNYADMAQDLAQVIEAEMPGGAIVMGHSMGGKASMALAMTRPDLVKGLVVADIAPLAYSHTQIQFIEAMRALDLSQVASRGDANRLMQETVPDDGVRAFLLQSLDVKERRWKLNLDVLAKEMATVTGWPEQDMAGRRYDGPTVFISGANSDYLTSEGREVAKGHFPLAKFFKIPGAGHWLHAEKPREFDAAVRTWIDAQAFS